VLVGWVEFRRELVWPVSWDVVVAVDIGTCDLLGESAEGLTAKNGGGAGSEKSLAGDAFGGLRRALGHRGDQGAACHRTRL